jgi:hypothetical protein
MNLKILALAGLVALAQASHGRNSKQFPPNVIRFFKDHYSLIHRQLEEAASLDGMCKTINEIPKNRSPTFAPTIPSMAPTLSAGETYSPTMDPDAAFPSYSPTIGPTGGGGPTGAPVTETYTTYVPTSSPTNPTNEPTPSPTHPPTIGPTGDGAPTGAPVTETYPSYYPTMGPTGSLRRRLLAEHEKPFCEMTPYELKMASGSRIQFHNLCDNFQVMQDFICNGICSSSCLSSDVVKSSGNDDSKAPQMNAVCADQCFLTMGSKLAAFEKTETECRAAGLTVDTAVYLADDDSKKSSVEDSLGGIEDLFSLGCTVNGKGENCLDKMSALEERTEAASTGEVDTCDSESIKDMLSLGCCFGTMLQVAAWEEAPTGTAIDEDEGATADMLIDLVSFLAECPGGETIFEPCVANAMKDMVMIKSEITFDGLDVASLSAAEKKATKKVIRTAIAQDVGVKEKQVIITRIVTSSTAARRLGTTSTVEYAISLDPQVASDANVQSKITSGQVNAVTLKTLASAGSDTPTLAAMSTASITPATTATESDFAAEPPAAAVQESNGMSTGAIVGIVVGALAAVALVVGAVVTKKRAASPDSSATDVADSSSSTEVADASKLTL